MTITNPMEKLRIPTLPQSPLASHIGPHVVFAVAGLAGLAILLRFGQGAQNDLLLPLLSGLFFVLAAAVAVLAWRQPRKVPRLTYWDVAGVFTLIGIFIAAAIEPEQLVRIVAGEDRQP